MGLLSRCELVVRLVVLATLLASCSSGQPKASNSRPAPSDSTSTRVALGAQGQLELLVDTPGGVVAFGADRFVPWALRSDDGRTWEPIDAPPELQAMTEDGSATFKGITHVLLSGGQPDDARLELLTTTDGVTWLHAAPALMAMHGIWGVGIVAMEDRLVVVGATGGNGVGHAQVFVSADGMTWEHLESPDLTRKDGGPVSVASADGRLAVLFSAQAGGGTPHVVVSDAALTSWTAVKLTDDSPGVTLIAPFLDGFVVAGCTRVGSESGLAWVSSSPAGPFTAVDHASGRCVDTGASSRDQVALATKAGAWFVDDRLHSTEQAFSTLTPSALPIVLTVVHRADAWLFGGQEHPDGSPLSAGQAVVWRIRP